VKPGIQTNAGVTLPCTKETNEHTQTEGFKRSGEIPLSIVDVRAFLPRSVQEEGGGSEVTGCSITNGQSSRRIQHFSTSKEEKTAGLRSHLRRKESISTDLEALKGKRKTRVALESRIGNRLPGLSRKDWKRAMSRQRGWKLGRSKTGRQLAWSGTHLSFFCHAKTFPILLAKKNREVHLFENDRRKGRRVKKGGWFNSNPRIRRERA